MTRKGYLEWGKHRRQKFPLIKQIPDSELNLKLFFSSERFEIPIAQTLELQRKHPTNCISKNTTKA